MVSGVAVVNEADFAFSDDPEASVAEATDTPSNARSIGFAPGRKLKVFGTCVAAMSLWAGCAGGMLLEALSSGFRRVGEVDPDLES